MNNETNGELPIKDTEGIILQCNIEDTQAYSQVKETLNKEKRNDRLWLGLGATALAIGLGAVGIMADGAASHSTFSYSVPFYPNAQKAINSVDGILADIGEGLVPLSFLTAGGLMVAASRKKGSAESINNWSSTELSDDENKNTKRKQIMKHVAAGSIPVLASLGAGLATFSSSIGEAITNGPSRPIEALGNIAPGNSWIVQDANAMPMVQSNLSANLVSSIIKTAKTENVKATPFNLNLGDFQYKGQNFTSLAIGIEASKSSPIYWNDSQGCNTVPVSIDKVSAIPIDSTIKLDGVNANIVEETSNISAINRVGIVMDAEAMATCINQEPNNMHAVVIDSSVAEAQKILGEANTNDEPATVITKQQYIKNSADFWRANVKPITNVLSLVSLGLAGVAMAGAAGARLYRNKRQWAQKLADGMSMNVIRSTELMRGVKEGIAASVIGVTGATLITPIVGIFESSFKPGAGYKEWFVGGAVGILGPVAGTLIKLIRPNKIISKEEDTRGV